MPTVADINPFSGFSFGGGGMMSLVILFLMGVFILGLVVLIIFMIANKKKYWIRIPLYRKVGNILTRVAIYKARVYPIGKAGDQLWFVKGAKKYIAPAVFQSAPNEFSHEEREDGEWINFAMTSVNDEQKKAGVKFIHQDMRSQRVATANLLEQRLMQKGFWEKWGVVIGYVIFFLIITVAVVINLYMMGKVVSALAPLVNKITEAFDRYDKACGGVANSIVPALSLLMFRGKK